MEDKEIKTMDLSNIYDEFPFMQSFPFNDYHIQLIANFDELGYEAPAELADLTVSFSYNEKGSDVHIFFIPEDIYFLYEKSKDIKTLDSVRELIDRGLTSPKIEAKTECVLDSVEFLEKVDKSYANIDNFDGILDDLIGINNADFSIIIADKIKRLLDGESPKLNKLERDVISSYLNFQLHHAKIILGVIIAAKIH